MSNSYIKPYIFCKFNELFRKIVLNFKRCGNLIKYFPETNVQTLDEIRKLR